jgi:predicted ATPase
MLLGDVVEEAEACFRDALETARLQGAKWWELRAAGSLARLLDKQNNRDQARAMLAEIYDQFTDGFDAPDLREAKALLLQLGA